MYVQRRFDRLLENLTPTPLQLADGETKHRGVRACLNRHYWNVESEIANSMLSGSWGKGTRVRPPRDIDVLFALPWGVYQRFEARSGNRQSQLLQEVKGVLTDTYSMTKMRGDGQVVVVPFATMPVEVVPGFLLDNGQVLICDANDGGSYRLSDPVAEIADLDAADRAEGGCVRELVRMMKQWQRHCDVPIKSFMLERLAIEFLPWWFASGRTRFWYDWMVRDFFGYLVSRAGGSVQMPGTGIWAQLGNAWVSKARTAHARAICACVHEDANEEYPAGYEWQQIFGCAAPTWVS